MDISEGVNREAGGFSGRGTGPLTSEQVGGAGGATPDQLRPAGDERSETLDVIRGVAVLGILSMNIAVFAMPFAGYHNPTVLFEYAGLNRATYWVVHTLFDMKMISIFSMLFGAGALLYAQKAAGREGAGRARSLWLRRMGWLLLIGMLHAYLIWEGDILVAYALTGLVVWWLRRLSVVWLLAVSAGFLLVAEALMALHGASIFWLLQSDEAAKMIGKDGELSFIAPNDEALEAQLATLRGDWTTIFGHRAHVAVMLQTMGFLFFFFWRAASMMLLGMALYKLGALAGRWSVRRYVGLTASGYVVGLPLVIGGIRYNESHGFDPALFNLVGMHFNELGSVGVAVGHLGLIGALVKAVPLTCSEVSGSSALRALLRRLGAVGRMALTCYLLESVLAGLIFYGYGLGMAGRLDRLEQQLVVLGVWALLLVLAPWWLARYRFGPVEWLWRSLTYWRRQPMRRAR